MIHSDVSRGPARSIVVEADDGIRRTFVGQKKEGKDGAEFRVYRIEGDITNKNALEESAAQLAAHFDCPRVLLRF